MLVDGSPHSITDIVLRSMFWDFLSSNPESMYQAMILFSDRGTPYGFRHMNAWTGHTYRYDIELMPLPSR